MEMMLITPFSRASCERMCITLSTGSGTNRRHLANDSYCYRVGSFSSFILLRVSAAPRWYFLFKMSLLTRSSKAMRWQWCSRVSCGSKRQTFWYSEPWKSILSVSNSGKSGTRVHPVSTAHLSVPAVLGLHFLFSGNKEIITFLNYHFFLKESRLVAELLNLPWAPEVAFRGAVSLNGKKITSLFSRTSNWNLLFSSIMKVGKKLQLVLTEHVTLRQ